MVERVKKALAPFYIDRCNVYESVVTDDTLTSFEKKTVYENIPCRLSTKSYLFGENAGSENKNTLKISKKIKLFFPPQYKIKPGSRVEVFHMGEVAVLGKSGDMNLYPSHNEVMVEIIKNYA